MKRLILMNQNDITLCNLESTDDGLRGWSDESKATYTYNLFLYSFYASCFLYKFIIECFLNENVYFYHFNIILSAVSVFFTLICIIYRLSQLKDFKTLDPHDIFISLFLKIAGLGSIIAACIDSCFISSGVDNLYSEIFFLFFLVLAPRLLIMSHQYSKKNKNCYSKLWWARKLYYGKVFFIISMPFGVSAIINEDLTYLNINQTAANVLLIFAFLGMIGMMTTNHYEATYNDCRFNYLFFVHDIKKFFTKTIMRNSNNKNCFSEFSYTTP